MENNKRIAVLLRQLAALLEEQGVAFKPAAYRHAAKVVEELPRDVAKYGGAKELRELPGIGESISKKIVEFLETGKIRALEKLRYEQGGLSSELMDIEGLGPKRVRVLQSELGVTTVQGLIKAAEGGKLDGLPGFSEVMQAKILENAKRVKERTRRFPRKEIEDDVEALVRKVRAVAGVERCEVAGSYRRRKETVGDIDMLVVTKSALKVGDAISELPFVRNVVAHGEKKLSFDLKSGIRVDIRFVRRDQWGAALLYFTGDKGHNIALRKKAIQRGWKLNEYGLFSGTKVIASREEEDIYRALGVPCLDPTKRKEVLPV
jgi:DNA polymerase (family 10)